MAVCLILTLLPATALAADTYTEWTTEDNLPTSGTYRLETDVTLTKTITIGGWASSVPAEPAQTLVLDLNGHTVTMDGGYLYVQTNGGLTIEDSVGTGKITNEGATGYGAQLVMVAGAFTMTDGTVENHRSNSNAVFLNGSAYGTLSGGTISNVASNGTAVFVNSQADFTMEDGTISNSVDGGDCIYVNTDATFVMNDGLVEQKGSYGSDAAIYNNGKGAIEITGGAVTSDSMGVYAAFAPVEVTGGTFETASYAFQTRYTTIDPDADGDVSVKSETGVFYSFRGSENAISGGQFDAPQLVKEYTTEDPSTLTITGGVFENLDDSASAPNNTEIVISSGKFTNQDGAPAESVKDYVSEGMDLDESGNIVVSDDSVAMIDGKPYLTLQDAVDAAVKSSGETTITLRKNASGDGVVVPSGSNIVFDLNTFTYDIDGTTVGSPNTQTNGFQLLRDSTITFKNGTITSSKAKILIQNYSDLTLDHVKLDGTNLGATNYTLSNNFGDVKIADSTIIAPAGGYAFDVYYWPGNGYGDGVSVTVEGDSYIDGNIQYGSDGSDTANVAQKASLIIKDGEFTGAISTYGLAADKETGIAISGGNFAQPVNEDYIVPGMMRDENGDIVVDPDASTKIAAMIDGKPYETLQAAVEAAKNGDVVKVFPGNHNLSYKDDNYNNFLLEIDDSITLMGVDYNGDPIIDPTQTKANIYSTDYVGNGSWPTQNLITVTADDVTIQGLTIMNKIAPNKSIEVVGSDALETFTVQYCKFAPISEELLEGLDAADLGGYTYEEYKEYGASLYFSEAGKYPMTATVEDNWFYYSGITLGGTTAGTYNITGNSFEGAKNWNKNSDYYYSTIGYQGKWLNPELHTLGTANVNISQNTFKNAGSINFSQVTEPTSGMPVFSNNTGLDAESISGPVKVDNETLVDSQEALAVALENASDGDTIVLADSFTITAPIVVTKDLTIDGNGKTITANNCVGFYIQADLNAFTVKDLTLEGQLPAGTQANEGTGAFMGIGTYDGCHGVEDLQLDNVTIDGFSYGLYFGKNPAAGTGPFNEEDVKITANDLVVQNCYIKGAYFEKLTDSTFTDCSFTDNGNDPDEVASNNNKDWMCGVDINLKNGSYEDIAFIDCTFTGNGANKGTALHIKARDDGDYGPDTTLNGVTVTGCTFKDNNEPDGAPIVLGEPGKNNQTPVNVNIQPDVDYVNNLAKDAYVTITFNSAGGDPVPSIVAKKGGQIELPTCTIGGNYSFMGWRLDSKTYDAGEIITVNEDLTFTAQWYQPSGGGSSSGGSSSSSSGDYAITVDAGKHGDVSVSPKRADKGDTVTITVDPDKGYEVDEVIVTDKDGDSIRVRDRGDGEYTFTMPDSKVTVEVTFVEASGELSFVDVAKSDYYYDAVKWAVDNGVTTGVTDTIFAPGNPCTRAQTVTFLWRAAGMPQAANRVNPFTDVSVNDYYYEAVLWAVENGITGGTTATTFSPNATCTRAQVVTFLWRYSKEDASILPMFTDVAESDYYYGAVAWAVENGVTTGVTDTTFAPGNPCTRGQIVTFLYRYMGK